MKKTNPIARSDLTSRSHENVGTLTPRLGDFYAPSLKRYYRAQPSIPDVRRQTFLLVDGREF